MSFAKFRKFSAIISVSTFSGSFSFYFVRVPNDINFRSFIVISQFLKAVSVRIFLHLFLNYSKYMPLPKGNQIPMSGQFQYAKGYKSPAPFPQFKKKAVSAELFLELDHNSTSAQSCFFPSSLP